MMAPLNVSRSTIAAQSWCRLGMYLPPLLEELGLAEVEHNPRNNRMRAR